MKKILKIHLICLLLLSVFNGYAQFDIDMSPERSKQRILILPFDPAIYVNDASMMWSKANDMSHDEIRETLRSELNRRLHIAMIDSCESVDLLKSYTKDARNELLGLYTTVGYEMRRSMADKPEEPKEESGILSGFFQKKKTYTDTVVKTKRIDGEIQGKSYSTHDKYLHVIYNNPNFISELCKRRNLDKVLFVNQLEITGNYGDPYLSGNSKATRMIKVHYSIYNFNGRLLHGGHAATNIPFQLKDIDEVMKTYFPPIVRQIILNIDFSQ
jgi:hypothetical protein